MPAKKNVSPVERILAWLDEGPEIENYATHEIEALHIEEVRQRLEKLGVDSSLPVYLKRFTDNNYASPAQKVLDALDDEIEELSSAEIEHLAPEDVTAKLNSLGLNYRTGIDKILELTEARPDQKQRQKHPVNSRLGGIWAGLKITGTVVPFAKMRELIGVARMAGVAAAAAAVLALVFVISHWSPLEKRAQSEPQQTSLQQQIAGLLLNRQRSSGAATKAPPTVVYTTTLDRHVASLPGNAQESIRSFYDVLLVTVKDQTLSKSERCERLASIVEKTFDLPFMAGLVVGSDWVNLSSTQQQRVTEALRHYIAATYVDNFESYSGEQLQVTGEQPYQESVIVQTKIVQSNGKANFVFYRMRYSFSLRSWQVSDAYIDSAVSELAKLRSEIFRPILQREGVDGLITEFKRLAG